MKTSFVKELGDRLFEETVENSYYNDECDVECYTPDFDSAYMHIMQQSKITGKDLKETFTMGDDNGEDEAVEYTGLDLLKLAVIGDFDGDNNSHSSEMGNLRMCASLIEKTNAERTIWEYKKNKEPVQRRGYSEHEYKKNLCDNSNLASLVGSRAESAAYRFGKEGLELAAKIGKALRGYEGFTNKEKCNIIESSLKPQEQTTSKIKKVAACIKNENYQKLAEIQDYQLRQAAGRYVIYGKSGDANFDKMIDSLKAIKEIIAEKDNTFEL